MEHAQRALANYSSLATNNPSLNPYFNGTCSKREVAAVASAVVVAVLILILMEHAQRAYYM